jgi:hypothetical protein
VNIRARGVFAPKILIPLLAAGAVGVGTVGVMSLLARRGEAAISMIPADAMIAFSFDNAPSPAQVGLFNEIRGAMDDSGLNDFVNDFLQGLDPQNGSFRKLREHIKGSFAGGVWGDLDSQKPDVVIAIALDDARGAEALISKWARPQTADGMTYYTAPDKGAEMILTFYGDYGVMASNVGAAQKAIRVARGLEPNLYEEASFKQARRSLPDDASFMMFVNGRAVARADENTRRIYESMGVHPEGWVACGVTLRREGIHIDSYEPAGAYGEVREALRSMRPLNYASLEHYPKGAIGVLGISSPSAYLKIMKKAFMTMPDIGPDLRKGLAEMEKETGTSVDSDWLPALRGEIYAALYPPVAGEKEPGFIISIDDSNGGTATKLFRKLVAKVNGGEFDKKGEAVRLVESQMGELSVFTPNKDNENGGGVAVVDRQVMLFSNKGVAAQIANPSGSLPDSEGLSDFTQGEPAQMRFHIDVQALFDMLERMGEMPKDVDLRQIVSGRQLTATGYFDGTSSRAHVLIPLNIPELIRVMGKQAKGQQGVRDTEAMPSPPLAPALSKM